MTRVLRRKNRNRKNLIRLIFIIIACLISYPVLADMYYEKDIKEEKNQMQQISEIVQNKQSYPQPRAQIVENLDIPKEFNGYKVIAKLEIPKIGVDTCVLEEFSKDALYECVTKYWGGAPNEIGNFCIAGHNSKRKNMFTDLKKLEIGDILILSDERYGKVTYEIYDIYKVKPTNVQCLSEETRGSVEITLITCTTDSNYRIIVKAREKGE